MKLGRTWAVNAGDSIMAGGRDPDDIRHMLGQAQIAYEEQKELISRSIAMLITLQNGLESSIWTGPKGLNELISDLEASL